MHSLPQTRMGQRGWLGELLNRNGISPELTLWFFPGRHEILSF